MSVGMPLLTHQQQQEAADRIHTLIAEGMSSGEAIALVAQEIRAQHRGEQVIVRFDDEDDEQPDESLSPYDESDTEEKDQ